ncbi:ribosome-inactivating family protein [Streptomyces sp. NPDC001822]|uniref:ribosome-inactivating family protein n=1 Tax=Streptomyces sp. NPDC001822 TaxID=3364614 RepID=UPI0036A7A72E
MPPSPTRLPSLIQGKPARLIALLTALLIAAATFLTGAGTAHADTGNFRIAHVYVNMRGEWDNPAAMAGSWGTFLQSIRNSAGHWYAQDTSLTQNGDSSPHALLRADLNVTNAQGHQTELRLWYTPNNMYLRGFTTTSVDASSPNNGNVTYYFNDSDFNLEGEMNYLRNSSSDRGLLPPANYQRLQYSGAYTSMARPPAQGGPGVTRDNTQMSYASLYNSVFQLAYLQRGSEQNGGNNFQATAASLLRIIQATSEAARFRDVQGIIIQMMANQSYQFTMPAVQQELENDWRGLSVYATSGSDQPGHYVGSHVPYITTVARALGYLALGLYPWQGSGGGPA